ncbi:MAG: HDOD domain-containing protein [Chloroflexi bacterium]|nr:HDOD domain-containing protein [Chloroflexota bacterium]
MELTPKQPTQQPPMFVARQPIVDVKRNVVGFELLFRDSPEPGVEFHGDGEVATARLLTEGVLVSALGSLTEGLPAWINMTEDVLTSGVAGLLTPPSQYVIEVLETVEPNERVLAECRGLRAKRFKVALDDVVAADRLPPFRGCYDIVKVDWVGVARRELKEIIRCARAEQALLLVEKVESARDLADALACGFDLFQGFAIARPTTLTRPAVTALGSQHAHLLEIATARELDMAAVEVVVRNDPALTFKVLTFANSSGAAQLRPVSQLRQALVLFGTKNLQRVALLLFLTQAAGSAPRFALVESLITGLLSESLASLGGRRQLANSCMLAGTLSHMDTLLGMPMTEVVRQLPIDSMITSALLAGDGPVGKTVTLARAVQAGDWARSADAAAALGVPGAEIPGAYLAAVNKARALWGPPAAA